MTLVEEVRTAAPRTTDTGAASPVRPPSPPVRRRLGGPSRARAQDLAGAAVTGISVPVLLQLLTGLDGGLGMALVGYATFLAAYALLVSLSDDRPAVVDAVVTVLLVTAAVVSFGALAVVVGFTLVRGWDALLHVNFFTQDLSRAGPLSPLSVGGQTHALVGTLWTVGIAVVLTVPVGMVAGVYLDVTRSRPARLFRTVVEAMTALPSILAGLFIYAAWILTFGFQRSGLAAGLSLSVMMLPYIIRAADLALRLVPGNLREASAALGASRWKTELLVVVPTARSGLATAVILGIARAIGEASPILLTAGYTTYMNADPVNGPMVSLPLVILKLVQSGVPTFIDRAFGAATFLLVVVIVLFVVARKIGGWGPGHLTPRGARRVREASVRDVRRYAERDRGADRSRGTGRAGTFTPLTLPETP